MKAKLVSRFLMYICNMYKYKRIYVYTHYIYTQYTG